MSESDLPKEIRLTKNEAALRQTMAAIEMYLQGRYECTVTLAGAAEGMVSKSENSMHQAHLTRGACRKLGQTRVHRLLAIPAQLAAPPSEPAHDPQHHRRQAEAPVQG
jgi:hypothetical protein